MNYILTSDNSFMYFFHSPLRGICLKEKKNGRWSESESIFKHGKDGFCVFSDAGNIHILCSDEAGAIHYLTNKDSEWKNFLLLNENEEISPLEFKVAKAGNIINFFYSAEYKNSYVLIHCVLGQNAKPEIIDSLYYSSPIFSISSDNVYYTNSNKVLGCRNFNDSKPGLFQKIDDNATDVYAINCFETENILYKKGEFIILNGSEVFSDPTAKKPLLSAVDNKLTIQWMSGNFVRYITSLNNGSTWSVPMRFIGSSDKICEFCILNQGEPHICYGQDLKPNPIIFGKSNLFFLS